MDNITHAATERSPEVAFDFANSHLRLKGESYPEDVAAFYGPLLTALDRWLAGRSGSALTLDIELVYFNSSSAKALMNLFLMLDKAGAAGNSVSINWRFSEDDDIMEEFGEDFAEDLQHVRFTLCPLPAS
ncbi:hypothetical protein GALL_159210 [mine drainage metagenome]|uniref:SiaC family regulatory phosphoprotein domain-containing protein n=1 Tax=mine drainage metagenome TaxID=410659 RepID=A0A1J5SPS6_9ZZZZ